MDPAKVIARISSVLFHPLFMPTLGIFILFRLNTYLSLSVAPGARRLIVLLIFVNTAIAPVLSILLLKQTGHVRNYLLNDRAERIFPLLIASVMFFLTYYFLRQISLPGLLYFFLIGATLLVLMSLLVSFLWKISIHMVSLGGFTAFLVITSFLLNIDIPWLIGAAFLFSGLTGASRIYLGAHSPAQVYAGYIMGFGSMLLLLFYINV